MLANWIDNLNERGRMALFGGVVLALAVLLGWVMFSGPDTQDPEAPAPSDETTVVPTSPTAGTNTGDEQAGEESAAPAGLTIDADPPVDAEQVTRLARHAADFTIAYQSMRYDEDPDAKVTRVRSMLSKDSQVNPAASLPDGPLLAMLRADQTVVTVTPTAVGVTMIAPTIVSFEVTAEVATTSAGTTTREVSAFNVTLYRDSASWGVGAFSLGTDGRE